MTAQKRLARQRTRRRFRVRNHVRKSANGRPRLSVFRSNKHLYAQIIDDVEGRTLVSAATIEKALFGPGKAAGNADAAAKVGELIAERATEKGIKTVIFDRGLYNYHGRVKAFADAARAKGLEF